MLQLANQRLRQAQSPSGGLMPVVAALRIAMIVLGLVEQVATLVVLAKQIRKHS
jgi:hypothetical protein